MRKLLVVLLSLMLYGTSVWASNDTEIIRVANGKTIGVSSIDYSSAVPIDLMTAGAPAAILFTVGGTMATTTGTWTLYQQVSTDGNVWVAPTNTLSSDISRVVVSAANTTQFIQFTPVPANYLRFQILGGGATQSKGTIDFVMPYNR